MRQDYIKNNAKHIILIFLSICVFPFPSFSSEYDSTEVQKQVVDTIIHRFQMTRWEGIRINVDKDGKVGYISRIVGNTGITSSDLIEGTFQFLEKNRDLFDIENPRLEFVFERIDTSYGHTGKEINVGLSQVENGIEFLYHFSGFRANFQPDSAGNYKLYSIFASIYPEARTINPKPTISAEMAKEIALNDSVNIGCDPKVAREPTLCFCKFDECIYLAWETLILGKVGLCGGTYLIDAHSGNILKGYGGNIQ